MSQDILAWIVTDTCLRMMLETKKKKGKKISLPDGRRGLSLCSCLMKERIKRVRLYLRELCQHNNMGRPELLYMLTPSYPFQPLGWDA